MVIFSDRDTFRLVELKRDYLRLLSLNKLAEGKQMVLDAAHALATAAAITGDLDVYVERIINFVTDRRGLPVF